MPEQDYIYQDRVVAFVDVLGFREQLNVFEAGAKAKKNEDGAEYLVSERVNEFINTFKEVTSLLDEENFRYYLFSDNICITGDYVENPQVLISLLFTIGELFYSFAGKGYFLRGGIAVGKFIDEKQIALGIPLAKAYTMESKDAVFPRILISEELVTLIKDGITQNKITSEGFDVDHLIYKSCEFNYLNVFYTVVKKETKETFFSTYKEKISENLIANATNEKIYLKYEWLAKEYNIFLNKYTEELIYTEVDEPSPEVVAQLKNFKIEDYGV